MTGRRLLGATLMPILLIAGCGGGKSSPPPTVMDFCNMLAAAECKVNCAGATPEPCETTRKAACMTAASMAMAGNTRFFTAANMGACISKSMAAYSSTTPIPPKTLTDIDRACNYVFQGTKKLLSDACTSSYECAGATNGTVVCDKGLCAMVSAPKAAGMPCTNPGDVCATGNYCMMSSATLYVCTARVATGGACGSAPCVEALRCSGGTCTDRVAAGQACQIDDDCPTAAPFCDPYAGFICDTGLSFAAGSPSCTAFTMGTTGAGGAGGATGTGGAGGTTGSSGAGGTGGRGGSGGTTGGAGAGGTTGSAGAGGGNQDAAAGG
jgi:hypothetical protein